MKLTHLLQFALAQTWAMEASFHARMFQVLMRSDSALDERLLAAAAAPTRDRRREQMTVQRGVAVIPIKGVIAPHASQVDPLCSDIGASVEHVRSDLQAALDDPAVQSILLAIDSPGGSVQGLDQLAADIRAARKSKPIIAHTDGMMASAAYWLGSQADRVFATRDSMVGSIGVIASFLDNHRQLQDRGLDPVVIRSVPGKGMTQSNGAVGDANRAAVQAEVDAYHSMFVEAVAAGRNVPLERANAMGDGAVHIGRQAMDKGLIDGLQQMDASIRIARSMGRSAAVAAAVRATPSGQPITVAADDNDPQTGGEGATDQHEPRQIMSSTNVPPATPASPAPVTGATTTTTPVATINPEAAVKAERDRVNAIMRAGAKAQGDLVARLIADGTPLVDALQAINADLTVKLAAQAPTATPNTHPLATGNTASVAPSETGEPKAKAPSPVDNEQAWRAEFDASADLQREFFGDFGLYAGWKRNERNLQAAKRRGEAKPD